MFLPGRDITGNIAKLDINHAASYSGLHPAPAFLHSGLVKMPCVAPLLPGRLLFNTMQQS
jgi:hypothetical protein